MFSLFGGSKADGGAGTVNATNEDHIESANNDPDGDDDSSITRFFKNDVGSFFGQAVSEATRLATTAADRLETLPGVRDFAKEQSLFSTTKRQQSANKNQSDGPVWYGYDAKAEEEMRAISTNDRNFLTPPPKDANFHFEMSTHVKTAVATMALDKALEAMRFRLVPRDISETQFWCNYFYRIHFIRQTAHLREGSDEKSELRRNAGDDASTEDSNQNDENQDVSTRDHEVPTSAKINSVSNGSGISNRGTDASHTEADTDDDATTEAVNMAALREAVANASVSGDLHDAFVSDDIIPVADAAIHTSTTTASAMSPAAARAQQMLDEGWEAELEAELEEYGGDDDGNVGALDMTPEDLDAFIMSTDSDGLV